MDNISELERLIFIRVIQEDAETIFTLLSSNRGGIEAITSYGRQKLREISY